MGDISDVRLIEQLIKSILVILTLAKKFLALGYANINRSSNSVKTIDIPTQYPPELLGRMLSGYPGRFSTNTSNFPLCSPLM